jgi:uncharacterized protein (DUF983 family)
VTNEPPSTKPSFAIDRVGGVAPVTTAPSRARTVWWGLTKRCPRCGSGHLFHRWFTIADDCPRCGLHFEREEGYWLGAMVVNLAVTLATLVLTFAIGLALTIPEVPYWLLAIVVPITVLVPIAFYPYSKTIWMAFDRAVLQRLDRNERLDQPY